MMVKNNYLSIAIIGQGYVGLPLALAAAESGLKVVGIDSNLEKVNTINAFKSPIEDISDERILEAFQNGDYRASNHFESLANAEIVVICVPTPLDNLGKPDLRHLISAVASAVPFLRSGALLINESTSFPGTLRDIIIPLVQKEYKGNFHSLFFASSPERINPGDPKWNISNTPRLVGGIDRESSEKAYEFYSKFCENVVLTSSPEIAESAKLLENSFRLVNIALINEFNQIFSQLGIDTNSVIDAASTKPYGFTPFRSGVGVGGHCIPIDPIYFSHWAQKNGLNSRLVELSSFITKSMPKFVADKAISIAKREVTRVLILGVSYKAGTTDTRESPALELIKYLTNLGINVAWHDPLVEQLEGTTGVEINWPCDVAILTINQPGLDISPILETDIPVLDCTNTYKNFRSVTLL